MPATGSKAAYCGSFYDSTGLIRETLYATAEGIYLLLEQAERRLLLSARLVTRWVSVGEAGLIATDAQLVRALTRAQDMRRVALVDAWQRVQDMRAAAREVRLSPGQWSMVAAEGGLPA